MSPYAVPLCVPGPLSEASSEPRGSRVHGSRWTRPALLPETLGVCSRVFATWERLVLHSGRSCEGEGGEGLGSCIPHLHASATPGAAWPGACVCRANASPAGDSLGLQGRAQGRGVHPWVRASRRSASPRPPALLPPSVVNLGNGHMLPVP